MAMQIILLISILSQLYQAIKMTQKHLREELILFLIQWSFSIKNVTK